MTVAYLKADLLSQHLDGLTGENHEKPHRPTTYLTPATLKPEMYVV
jgi:hypothetical protein